MKIECLKEKLQHSLLKAEKITGKNLSLPILSSILLYTKNNTLNIRATNLDVGIEMQIPVKVEKEGIIAVSGSVLYNLLSGISFDTVILEIVDNNLTVKTPYNSAVINSFPNDDFPTLPKVKNDSSFKISSYKLINGLKTVYISSSVSDIKPEIASVYIYTRNGGVVFVATDSFRLSEKKISLEESSYDNFSIIIPIKNIIEIIRVFDGSSDEISVIFDKNQISFQQKGVYLTSRLIDGIFPDYEQIIPKKHITEVIMLKNDLVNALKLSNIFSDKFNKITFSADPLKKKFIISSQNSDIGEHKNTLETTITGEPITLGFNYKYVSECLQPINTDSISLQFNGEGKPMIIQGVGDTSSTALVMPLN